VLPLPPPLALLDVGCLPSLPAHRPPGGGVLTAPPVAPRQVLPADLTVAGLALDVLVTLCAVGTLEVAHAVDGVELILLADERLAALAVSLALLGAVHARHAAPRRDDAVASLPVALQRAAAGGEQRTAL